MNLAAHKKYRRSFLLGLLVLVVTSWFSVGYNHPDEHFQVLEFCNYKLFHSPLADLPWEYSNHCRSALQPFVAFGLCKSMVALGVYDPFIAAFLLRLGMSILAWWVTCRMVLLLLPEFVTPRGRDIFVGCNFFLWFVPYLGVRFSAENTSAVFFFLALSFIMQEGGAGKRRRVISLFVAGLLLGFTLFLRLQMGFAFVGLAVWMLFFKKVPFTEIAMLIFGGLVAAGLSVLVDYWFYGVWFFSPYNYFNVNIIQNVAAKFGVQPWWYYFVLFFQYGFAPLALCLIPLFFIGVWKKPRHVMALICVPFFLGHFLVGHKEMRFLFPLSYAFIFLISTGIDTLLQNPAWGQSKLFNGFYKLMVGLNIGMLVFKMFMPSQEVIRYFEFISGYSKKHNTTLIAFNKSPFRLDTAVLNFYKPNKVEVVVLHNPDSLTTVLNDTAGRSYIFLSHDLHPEKQLPNCHTERLYSFFPDWLLAINLNHWQDRSNIWAVYSVRKE